MTAALPTWALWLPVSNRNAGVAKPTRGLVLHVQVGRGSLRRWFNNKLHRASSTWWVSKTGVLECYVNPDTDRAWAQSAGNYDWHSLETEGSPGEPLTGPQIETSARLFAWGHKRYGWPLALAESRVGRGFGWHGMGGFRWGNHPNCPGVIRRAQRVPILARARVIAYPPKVPPVTYRPGSRTLQFGSHGPDVAFLQRFLGVASDSDYGPKTTAAVRQYQLKHALDPDGICGPRTWAKIL